MEISQVMAAPNQVIVERIEEDEVRASGIILICNEKNSRDPIAKGKVLSVGRCTSTGGNTYEPDVKAGDIVLYRRNAFVINIPHDLKSYFSLPISRVEVVLGE